jgi:3-hexulose-6-phosphate synthase/6-phospho-3-hexuloisomerase
LKPIVQISLDLTSIPEALETAAMALRAGVDWLEAGTPLIIAEGMNGVRALRKAFPARNARAAVSRASGIDVRSSEI